jgi:hypothetical protein
MLGLMLENGPIHVLEDGSIVENQFSWDKLVDYVFIDQPVYVMRYIINAHVDTYDVAQRNRIFYR